jgi:Membrane bound FAD containing D-sorbitol dehydrogenase
MNLFSRLLSSLMHSLGYLFESPKITLKLMEPPELFRSLSSVLTGEDVLDTALSEEYRARLQRVYSLDLNALMSTFSNLDPCSDVVVELDRLLDQNSTLANVARQVIKVWYTGQFTEPDGTTIDGPKTPDQYRSGLLWKVIQAHAPGYTNGTYGYWATAPQPDESKTPMM